MANFRGMELVPGALEKLSGGGGGNRREPTPPARNLSASCRGDIPPSPGLPIVHARSGSDTLDPRGVGVRPTGSVIRGGRPLSGGSRSGSRVDVNLSTSPNPNQFQPYQQEVVSQFDGNVNSGTGSGPGSDGDSLIQRCVIIQRGEKGYGLTVSGDNPVFVQDVKPHGAAARAGVQPGDRIMKVNGTLVTSSNHVEVVRMIKSGSLVSLTLLGRPPGSNAGHRIHHIPPQPANDGNSNFAPHAPITDITEPKPSEADHEQAMTKVRNLQRYLDKAIAEREVLSTEYRKHPQDKYYGKILENHRLIESLDSQVKGACRKAGIPLPPGMVPEGSLSPSAINSKFPYPYDGTSGSIAYPNSHEDHQPSNHDLHSTMTNISANGVVTQSPASSPHAQNQLNLVLSGLCDDDDDDTGCEMALFNVIADPTPTPSDNIYPSSPDSRQFGGGGGSGSDMSPVSPIPGLNPTAPPFPPTSTAPFFLATPQAPRIDPKAEDIINMEDDDLSDDLANNDSGPFSDFAKLKQNPAHLAVFLKYLITNSDPSSLFFFLITESYTSSSCSIKDLKRWAYEISSTFLFEGSPLCLRTDGMEGYLKVVNDILETKVERESDLRHIFDSIRLQAKKDMIEALCDFRQKRALGLGSFYGDHLLQEVGNDGKFREPLKQLRIVEDLLLTFLKDWTNNYSEWEEASERNQALAFCLATFFKIYGLEKVSKRTDLERIPVFLSKQTRGFNRLTGGGESAKKIVDKKGHKFTPSQFTMKTECEQCTSLLWGIGTFQGYQCQHCSQNFHKSCLNSIEKECHTDRKNKNSFFPGLAGKKNTRNNDNKGRDRRSTSPSNVDKKGTSPANEDEQKDDVKPLPTDGVSGSETTGTPVGRSNSIHNDSDNKTSKKDRRDKIQRSKSDPKVDQEEIRQQILNQGGQLSSPASASQSSLDSSGSTNQTHQNDSDSESAKPPDPLPTPTISLVSDPISDDEYRRVDELPRLEDIIDAEHLKKMNKKEKEKQKVINELFHTEMTHVRHLRVLEALFFIPLLNDHIMAKEDMDMLFPNLKDIINIHTDLQHAMTNRRNESLHGVVHSVSDILLETFKDKKGQMFRETCANFLKNQAHALEMLRMKTRKDMKLAKFLQEKEEDQRCRRLQLKDLLPEEMQRMVKYPILLESLAKHIEKDSDEHKGILEAIKESKGMLNYINLATRDCMNKHTLQEIQKKLETGQWERSGHTLVPHYKDLDLREREMIHTGSLKWRVTRQKIIELQVLLFKDIIVLLQKQDDKYILKCQGTPPNSPIIDMKHVLMREVATDKRAFFLVSIDPDRVAGEKTGEKTSLYELVSISVDERKRWQDYIETAVKEAGGTGEAQRSHAIISASGPPNVVSTNLVKNASGITIFKPNSPEEEQAHVNDDRRDQNGGSTSTLTEDSEPATRGSMDLTPTVGELVQPGEVTVQTINAPVAVVSRTGETLSTPQDQLKSKDSQIRKLLSEKQRIVSGMLGIPVEEFAHVAESAASTLSEDGHRQPKDSRDMALALWHQVHQLTILLNDHQSTFSVAVDTNEEVPVEVSKQSKSASLGRHAYLQQPNPRNRHTSSPSLSSSPRSSSPNLFTNLSLPPHTATIPTSKLVPIVSSLQENLSSLLSVMEISSSSSAEDDVPHPRMVRADSIPPYPPPPPPGRTSDETTLSSSPSATPVAPPTPFAGGYRGPRLASEGVGTESDYLESSPSPIPICPPPPKDLLLPTTSSTAEDDDEELNDVEEGEETELDSRHDSTTVSEPAPSQNHSPPYSSAIPQPPPRPNGRGSRVKAHPSSSSNSSTPSPSRPSLRNSLSPPRTRAQVIPPSSSPKPTSSLPRHVLSNNQLVMEEGEESFVDDEGDVDGDDFRADAALPTGKRDAVSSSHLEGGIPFETPQLEEDDDDDFESNTTYV